MNNSNKNAPTLFLVTIIAVSLIVLGFVSAQSVQPASPEFTVRIGDHSYDIPTTYSTDKYTGETITHQGYRVENKTIDIIIKNQPFNPQDDGSGNVTGLYYTVRAKGHFGNESDWKNYKSYPASNQEYTTISFSIDGYYSPYEYTTIYAPPEGKIDIQVQTLIGYYHVEWVSMGLHDHPLAGGMANVFYGEKSDWSTQILDMSAQSSATSPESNSTPTPTAPEFPAATILVFLAGGLLIAATVKLKKSHPNKPAPFSSF